MKYMIMALLMAFTINAQSQLVLSENGHDQNVIDRYLNNGYVYSCTNARDNTITLVNKHVNNKYWVVEIYPITAKHEYSYRLGLWELDFRNKRMRRIEATYFRWNGTKYEELLGYGSWVELPPGSIGDYVLSTAKTL